MRALENVDPTPVSSRVDGRAELVFAQRGSRTVLTHSRLDAPMAMVRPFELPDGRLVVPLVTLGPGLCAGDSVRLDVAAGDGARVVVTTTAATRIMAMDAGQHAEQHVALRAGHGAVLEYYPAVTIPFPGSAFTQTVHVVAEPDARVGVLESWALGRAARGEHLRFRHMSSRVTMFIDSVLRYADATYLEPALTNLDGPGILAGHQYLAAGFWYGADLPAGAWNGGDDPDALAAFAQSSPGLVYLRALGRDAPAIGAVLRRSTDSIAAAWDVAPVVLDRFHA
jgi:urease accessory protein UreH